MKMMINNKTETKAVVKLRKIVACSRRSDTEARAKKKASERAGKKRGETGEEDEGTPVKLILKKLMAVYQNLVYPLIGQI